VWTVVRVNSWSLRILSLCRANSHTLLEYMSKTIFRAAHTMTLQLTLSQKSLLAVLLGLCYALFVVLFPWDAISRGGFPDFHNYVYDYNYLIPQNESAIEFYHLSSVKEYFTNEVLWVDLVRNLTGLTGGASIALRIISFFILFVWGLFLLKRVSYGVALLFLFNPFAIDVAMSGIRNGLAYSLVMIGISIQSKVLRGVLFLAGMFIHSSTLVLAIFYYSTKLASRYAKGKMLLVSGLGIGIFIGLALTVGSELVLGAIGDRRMGENYVVGGGSLMQASLWGALIFFQCTSGRAYIRQNILVIAVLAWYLAMNPFIPWSYRILGAFMPVIGASAMYLPHRKRKIFIYLYSGYLVLQYLYWTKLFNYWYWA